MSRKSHTAAERSFRCHVCGKVFGQKGHLLIHKNVHAVVRPFGCDTCGRRFTQKGNLLRHSVLHTNEKPFGCGICKKFFVQKAHLVKHVVVHRQRLAALKRCRRREASEVGPSAEAKETSLRCKVCGLQFRRIFKLMEHLKVQHILGNFIHRYKGAWREGQIPRGGVVMFGQKGHLEIHKVMEMKEVRPYEWDTCGRRFTQKGNLLRLSLLHANEEPFGCGICRKCQVCDKVFGQKGHLLIHKNVHAEVRPFGCDTCGRRFTQKGNLLRHSVLHTNEKPFGCGICKKFFVQKAHLVKHVVVHRQRLAALKRCRRREASEVGPSAEAKETSLRCKVCGLQFSRIFKLMEHLKVQHILGNFIHRYKGAWREGQIPRGGVVMFGQKGHLEIHKVMEMKEVRPYEWDTCGRRFTQKGNLLRHSLLHANEKPFGCGICRRQCAFLSNDKPADSKTLTQS
ncbi:zinc finger protein OZF-like [Penaeus monodon]|uniref:zinc finger protein OZF-like n=1 Tax=Penaeus monodon TaxID=6687 RepID=UPI0018A7BC25|nr:zinc finger protein OZF-like [Penaeus monodon]